MKKSALAILTTVITFSPLICQALFSKAAFAQDSQTSNQKNPNIGTVGCEGTALGCRQTICPQFSQSQGGRVDIPHQSDPRRRPSYPQFSQSQGGRVDVPQQSDPRRGAGKSLYSCSPQYQNPQQ